MLAAFGLLALPASGREAPIKVLVAAPVADDALGTIAPAAWSKYVGESLPGYQPISFPGLGEPVLDDCLHAGAEYMVVATFERRLQLPGLGVGASRTAARARRKATDCITGDAVADDVVNFESDPASGPDTDIWEREIGAAFAKRPLALPRPARVLLVQPPLVRVSFHGALLHEGDVVKDIANPRNVRRSQPIVLNVTQTHTDYVEATFDGAGPRPQPGDVVER